MAAGAFVFPDLATFNFFNATNLLAANTSNYKLALVKSTWTPADSTDEVWADVSAHEVANSNGYVTGGGALTGVALSHSAGETKFTASPFTWTASGAGIPAWRRGVVYYSGTLNGKVNPLVGHFLANASDVDEPTTTSGNTLAVSPNSGGILTASQP